MKNIWKYIITVALVGIAVAACKPDYPELVPSATPSASDNDKHLSSLCIFAIIYVRFISLLVFLFFILFDNPINKDDAANEDENNRSGAGTSSKY